MLISLKHLLNIKYLNYLFDFNYFKLYHLKTKYKYVNFIKY